MKRHRHELILRAVAQGNIATQDQLLSYLEQHGMMATQATVSRDIKELRLRKVESFYEVELNEGLTQKYRTMLRNAVEDVDGAGNIVCVRCGAGLAQSACVAIDAMPPEGLIGSIAGEDTVFLLCRDEAHMQAIQEEIQQFCK